MHSDNPDETYRMVIDRLAHSCRDGQGHIGARRARNGVWNENATADYIPEQHEVNILLARMSREDREILAACSRMRSGNRGL